MKYFITLLAALALTGCMSQDKEKVEQYLTADGYTNVEVGGWTYGACSESDNYSNSFTGYKNGFIVDGVVCGGWWKNSTIRINSTVPANAPMKRTIKHHGPLTVEQRADSILKARADSVRARLIDSLKAVK